MLLAATQRLLISLRHSTIFRHDVILRIIVPDSFVHIVENSNYLWIVTDSLLSICLHLRIWFQNIHQRAWRLYKY